MCAHQAMCIFRISILCIRRKTKSRGRIDVCSVHSSVVCRTRSSHRRTIFALRSAYRNGDGQFKLCAWFDVCVLIYSRVCYHIINIFAWRMRALWVMDDRCMRGVVACTQRIYMYIVQARIVFFCVVPISRVFGKCKKYVCCAHIWQSLWIGHSYCLLRGLNGCTATILE